MYSNLQIHQDDVFTIVLTHTTDATEVVTGTVTNNANGIYNTEYTLSKAGDYNMVIQVQPKDSVNTYNIAGSPFPVSCSVTTTASVNTILTGTGVTAAVAGIQDTFTVTLFDSGNN